MSCIQLGIIGLGRFAQLHMECLRQMPNVKIAAICDINVGLVSTLSQALQCNGYTDVQEMLRAESLHAIDVLTPEAYHYDAVMAGLEAGCHVFVEKPLEINLFKASRMISFAAEKDRLLMVGHVTRFDPRYMNMKQAIERGDIGRIRSIYTRRSDKREYFGIYKRTPVVFILGVHDIDQILWYKNELPQEVYAKRSSSDEGEDMVCAIMTFQDGTLATMDSNWLTPKGWPAPQDQYTQIMGDTGVLRMQNPDQAFSLCLEDRYEFPFMFATRDIYGQMEGPLMSELKHFMDCIVSTKPSTILRPEDALNVVRVATAIIRSCEQNQPVLLSSVNS
jgi:UDP-N-acetylglucosamine 3-dehydrogenase